MEEDTAETTEPFSTSRKKKKYKSYKKGGPRRSENTDEKMRKKR